MRYRFYTADVFTDQPFGGNPLAVVTDAAGLTAGQMQIIAREFNLSETTFVLPPDDPAHTCRVRIFTPNSELPFAGHPTVGTAIVLASIGAVKTEGRETRIVFEEGVGPVPVSVFATDGKVTGAQFTAARVPERGPEIPPPAAMAAVLSLNEDDLAPGESVASYSCGVPFVFVPLKGRATVARARVNPSALEAHLGGSAIKEIFLFTCNTEEAGVDVHARMFAPGIGIPEDPATGSAAAALAGWLAAHATGAGDGTRRWTIAQGVDMGRPSRIALEADIFENKIRAVRVGGAAALISDGEILAPPG